MTLHPSTGAGAAASAAATAIAAEIARRVNESDYHSPTAFGVDPADAQRFLASCAVRAGPPSERFSASAARGGELTNTVSVAAAGATVFEAGGGDSGAPTPGAGRHSVVSAAWTDDPVAFVDELEYLPAGTAHQALLALLPPAPDRGVSI